MIFTPDGIRTEITLANDGVDGKIIHIAQRVFGTDRINNVYVSLDNLQEFLNTLEG